MVCARRFEFSKFATISLYNSALSPLSQVASDTDLYYVYGIRYPTDNNN